MTAVASEIKRTINLLRDLDGEQNKGKIKALKWVLELISKMERRK